MTLYLGSSYYYDCDYCDVYKPSTSLVVGAKFYIAEQDSRELVGQFTITNVDFVRENHIFNRRKNIIIRVPAHAIVHILTSGGWDLVHGDLYAVAGA